MYFLYEEKSLKKKKITGGMVIKLLFYSKDGSWGQYWNIQENKELYFEGWYKLAGGVELSILFSYWNG